MAAAPGVGYALRAADETGAAALPRPKRSEANRAERSNGPCRYPPPSDRAEKRRAWGERVPKDTRIVVWLAEAV